MLRTGVKPCAHLIIEQSILVAKGIRLNVCIKCFLPVHCSGFVIHHVLC